MTDRNCPGTPRLLRIISLLLGPSGFDPGRLLALLWYLRDCLLSGRGSKLEVGSVWPLRYVYSLPVTLAILKAWVPPTGDQLLPDLAPSFPSRSFPPTVVRIIELHLRTDI